MIQVIQSMFSNYNVFKLEINNRKFSGKSLDIWKQCKTVLNNPGQKRKGKLEHILNWIKNENTIYQKLGNSAKAVLSGKCTALKTYI